MFKLCSRYSNYLIISKNACLFRMTFYRQQGKMLTWKIPDCCLPRGIQENYFYSLFCFFSRSLQPFTESVKILYTLLKFNVREVLQRPFLPLVKFLMRKSHYVMADSFIFSTSRPIAQKENLYHTGYMRCPFA